MKLDQFTTAYLQCALFTGTDDSNDSGGDPLDHNYSISDFSKEALQKALADCAKFQEENIDDIMSIPDWSGSDSYTNKGYTNFECAGHDFWFTRNNHGVGFWDREYLTDDQQKRLTDNAHKFGECYVYVGDDGLLYID